MNTNLTVLRRVNASSCYATVPQPQSKCNVRYTYRPTTAITHYLSIYHQRYTLRL